jgi:D-beta-D-heptose 7-phosphate kinase/D-beta-D-heptose 1-phosphate adenosyltransferase
MSHLKRFIDRWHNRRVLVVGDVMLDEYISVRDTGQKCPEDDGAAVLGVKNRFTYAGGAANAAVNLATLGANVTMLGAIGDDQAGLELDSKLANHYIGARLVVTPDQPTTTKRRIISNGKMIARIDENQRALTIEEDRQLASELRNAVFLLGPDAILLSDYSKGVLDSKSEVVETLADVAEIVPTIVLDPRRSMLDGRVSLDAVTPNRRESIMLGGPGSKRWFDTIPDLRVVVETRGAWGAVIREPGRPDYLSRTVQVERADVCGAGDTFAAALTLARTAGADWLEAVEIANVAAGEAVRHLGTYAPSADEVRARL